MLSLSVRGPKSSRDGGPFQQLIWIIPAGIHVPSQSFHLSFGQKISVPNQNLLLIALCCEGAPGLHIRLEKVDPLLAILIPALLLKELVAHQVDVALFGNAEAIEKQVAIKVIFCVPSPANSRNGLKENVLEEFKSKKKPFIKNEPKDPQVDRSRHSQTEARREM